ncbi:MAG TPA: SufD family Fe-S cluster assembly protein, partial [Acidimicrobiales bacterium]|nr:SufD family Fe-S cluster assembly protein [Acidimicrobiales bacterium]
PGPTWLSRRRSDAAERFSSSPLPTEKDEVWRYSRIDELDLDRFHPVDRPSGDTGNDLEAQAMEQVRSLVARIGPRTALVVSYNGGLVDLEPPAGADGARSLGPLRDHAEGEHLLGAVASDPGDFVRLNEAFAPDPIVVDVPARARIEDPIVVVHVIDASHHDGGAVFPRTVIRAGEAARAGVVEMIVDLGGGVLGDGAPAAGATSGGLPQMLVVPVTEVQVGDGATLSYVSVQALGPATWQLGYQVSRIGSDASLRSFAVALGGDFARLRTDSELAGQGGTSELRAAYLGRDDQMLDFRTLQDHSAPRTTSDLLFKGAVADRAHSVYSGLIRVHRGAVRSDAMQTNNNLVLDEGAHADSVPNLDIEENDVRCSHGSTVGPVDEEQRYYLESGGIDPDTAERLIVAGFFLDIAQQLPIEGVRPIVQEALAHRLHVPADGPLGDEGKAVEGDGDHG